MMRKAAVMSSTKKPTATREDVEREASRYILHELGDRLWAGDPVYDSASEQWSVPVHSLSLPEEVGLGQITLDAQGAVVKAPSRRAIRSAFEKYQSKPEPRPSPTVERTQPIPIAALEQGNLALMTSRSFVEKLYLVTSGSESIEVLLTDSETHRRGMSICHHYARNYHNLSIDADDLFEMTCLRIWKAREHIEGNPDNVPNKEAFFVLFSTAASHVCIDLWRKYKKFTRHYEPTEFLMLPDPQPGPELDYVSKEFEEYFEGLPEETKQIVRGSIEGKSIKEISIETGLSSLTVRHRLMKALTGFVKSSLNLENRESKEEGKEYKKRPKLSQKSNR